MDDPAPVGEDEFRVEIELDSNEHHLTLGERIRALDLDDEARERLGSRVIVTRDGSHLFLYANTEASAREAERVVREILAEDQLEAEVETTRWHPVEAAWKDVAEPLPETGDALEAEEHAREEREADQDDGIKRPEFVMLGSYKPQFLRDLGL